MLGMKENNAIPDFFLLYLPISKLLLKLSTVI